MLGLRLMGATGGRVGAVKGKGAVMGRSVVAGLEEVGIGVGMERGGVPGGDGEAPRVVAEAEGGLGRALRANGLPVKMVLGQISSAVVGWIDPPGWPPLGGQGSGHGLG